MNWTFRIALPVCILALCGCGMLGLKPEHSPGVETEIEKSERYARESRTLSHLAALEAGISDFVKAESRIPTSLQQLVPKFIAEIPTVELAIPGHRPTSETQHYPSDVIRNGAVDGTRIWDTGRWGYVYNDRQVIVFVDCTHLSSRNKPWYQERGVF